MSQDDTPKKISLDARAHPLYVALMSEVKIPEVTLKIAAEEYKKTSQIGIEFNRNEPLNPYRVPLHKNLSSETGRVDVYA